MRAVRALLSRAGQRLPLDVGSPAATVGGVIGANEAGPLRLAYGTPRDLIIGARVGLADGSLVRAMPGLDVPRLMCGALGTLGIVAEATIRVQPVPETRTWVVRPVATPRDVHEFTAALLASSFAPAAIEADLPGGPNPGELAVLLEGSRAAARSRAEAVARILGGGATVNDTPPVWWGRYPFDGDERAHRVALRIAAPSSELFAAVYALRDAAGVSVPVRGSAGVGVVHAALPDSLAAGRIDGVLTAARAVLLGRGGGSVTVVRAPAALRGAIDATGPVPLTLEARQAKAQLDPAGRLSPGRVPLP
jgi:glycolate oxidase FAD binding subunit